MRAGWGTTTLDNVCKFENGDRGKNYPGRKAFVTTGIPFINAGHLGDGEIDWQSMNYIPRKAFEILGNGKVKKGDLLFCLRGSLGKFGVVDKEIEGAIASSLVIVRPMDRLNPDFLSFYFRSDICSRMIAKYANGAAQPNLSAKNLKLFELPLPQLNEQKYIVTILDEAFAGISKAVESAERNLANARELFESYLNNIFSQMGEGWIIKTLGEVGKVSMCKRILKKQTSASGDIPFYKIGTFGKEPNAFISNDIYQDFREKYSFPEKGDVLISASGTIGRRVIYDGMPAYFQDSNIVWIDNDEKLVLNDYLYHFYGVCDWKPSKGATISRLYNDDLRKIKISFPSIAEQKKLIETMVELNRQTQNLEAIYQNKLSALVELKQSLLQKAFSGELTAENDKLKDEAAA